MGCVSIGDGQYLYFILFELGLSWFGIKLHCKWVYIQFGLGLIGIGFELSFDWIGFGFDWILLGLGFVRKG